METYLETPIEIDGVKIGHTKEGLKYLIPHYERMLKIASPQQLSDKDRQYLEFDLLVNLKYHLSLYDKQNLINQPEPLK